MSTPRHSTIRLEVDSLVLILHKGCLAASPMAATVADPFAYGELAETRSPVCFTFSDIPDFHFREPGDIILMSHIEGGSKS